MGNVMKGKYVILTAVFLLMMSAFGFSQGKQEPVQSLAARVSKAFTAKKLSTLDGGNFIPAA